MPKREYGKFQSIHLWVPNIFEFKGGIQVYLNALLEVIKKKFPDLELVIADKLDRTQPEIDFSNNESLSFFFSGNVPFALRSAHFGLNLLRLAFSNRPNLIICAHLNFAPVAWFVQKFTDIPYWIIVYGLEAWNIEDRWKKAALKNAEKIVSISGYTRDRLLKEQQLSPDKFFLLPVTFDPSRFVIQEKPQYLLDRYQIQPARPIILTVSRLDIQSISKGYEPILKALPEVRKYLPNICYILVGKGSDRPRIERLIVELNLEQNVILAGFVPDDELNDYYNLCDLFAMVGKTEGFGIVYLEALACGKPALGGNRDGALDALCHGKLGALVDPEDKEAIARTIVQILQRTYPQPIMYQPEALRQKIIDLYGWERFENRISELFYTADKRR
jgi:glycosyltransferase involved in cell wall biosynthesis